ncbi:MAG: beta-lactamase family protein [Robiginitomaculum sp.]|nr:beta-lactamase family protein [Robiginitomaculum sp.]
MKFLSLLFALGLVVSCSKSVTKAFDENAIENNLIPAVEFGGAQMNDMTVQSRMEHYGSSAFSISVINDGQIVWTKAYGTYLRDGERPISINTRFQAASLSKAIAGLGVMKLVDEEKIELFAPVNQYLQSWRLPQSKFAAVPITVNNLLSHTAGVSTPSFSGYGANADLPNINQILDGLPPANSLAVEVSIMPGEYQYSGGGYMVLQKIIEDISDKSFEEYMQGALFAPLGINQTSFDVIMPNDKANDIAPGMSWSGHTYDEGWWIYPEKAAAGLWSTPNDLAVILNSYIAAYQGNENHFFSQGTAHLMAKEIDQKMGLGFGVHGTGKALHMDHAGWARGYRSYMVVFPETGDGAVLMANGNGSHRLIQEMTRSIAKEFAWPAFKSQKLTRANWTFEQLNELAGNYRMNPAGFVISLAVKDDYLILSTPRGTNYTVYPTGENELVIIEDGLRIPVNREGNISLSMWGMQAVREE